MSCSDYAMTDLSIIIVNWNAGPYLSECLRSIKSGTHRCTMEILVVDNASTDGSLEAGQKEFPEITFIQTGSNLGFAKANNIATRRSIGRYICLINPDVVVGEGCLDRMCSYMDEHSSIGILGPKTLNPDLTAQFTCRRFPSLWSSLCRAMALDVLFPDIPLFSDPLMRSWTHDTARRVGMLAGCFWMVRRETLEQVGLLDEGFFMYSEDLDYCKRCWLKGWPVVYFPEVTALHYGGVSSSHLRVHFEVELLKSTLRYWKKYHGRFSQAAFSGIKLLHQARRILVGGFRYVFRPSKKQTSLIQIKSGVACSRLLLRSS